MPAKPADDQVLISNLEFLVERSLTDVERAKERLNETQAALVHAEALLTYQRSRVGVSTAINARFGSGTK